MPCLYSVTFRLTDCDISDWPCAIGSYANNKASGEHSCPHSIDMTCLFAGPYSGKLWFPGVYMYINYSEILLLRPSKINPSCLLKTLLAKFKLFFSSFSTPSVPLIRDHLWYCPKVVCKTTFEQTQRWS